MATRKSSIGADLVIDRRKFKAALDASKGDAARFAASLEAIKQPRSGVLAPDNSFSNKWSELGGKVTAVKGAFQATQKVLDKISEPQRVEMEFETALAGLSAVADKSETLAQQMEALSALGDKPGLGFTQVMEASVGLQAVGQSAAEARDTMEQFGNAVANVGGGKQEFSEVMMSVRQILSTGSVDMENLKEIAARIPQFLTIANSLDRSSAPGFVKAAVEKLKELPRAATTAQEALGNLDDAWKKLYVQQSDGALVANVKARVERAVEQLKKGGMSEAAVAKIAEYWGGVEAAVGGNTVKLTDLYQPSNEELDRREKSAAAAAAAKKAAADKAAADKAAEGLAIQEELTAISDKQLEIEEEKHNGNAQRLAQLEQELRMMTEGKEIMEKTGLAADVVADHLQRRADHEKEIERLRATAGNQERAGQTRADAQEQLRIDQLRAGGKTRQADKLEAARTERQRKQELIDSGLPPDEAAALAGAERQTQEDAAYFQRTGRRKIRGQAADNRYRGLDDRKGSGQLMTPNGLINDPEQGLVSEWNFDALNRAKEDRKNRPLKSEIDRANGAPSITPDKMSGMTLKQAEDMLEALRAIRAATESNIPTAGDQTKPRNVVF